MAPPLEPGLYLVSTPIGNLGDITIRALQTLAGADRILCEDTRVSRVLLERYAIGTPLSTYHEHNATARRPRILADLDAGARIALVSDAGTPLISDPGYRLVVEAAKASVPVIPIPGASAVLAGLAVSGLPSDRFQFAGFLSPKAAARQRQLTALTSVAATLIFFEAPGRLAGTLEAMAAIFGGDRPAAVTRELTKRHEETLRGSLGDLAESIASRDRVRGEIVILVGPPDDVPPVLGDVTGQLAEAVARLGPSRGAAAVARATGLSKRDLYSAALDLKDTGGTNARPDDTGADGKGDGDEPDR